MERQGSKHEISVAAARDCNMQTS
uniref:Uncharacterized protein n=1 Tax=Arundo donax TaxID=35708 RepID=A0A0A9A146_ARUDO